MDPLDYRWMRTYATKPTVQVTVNGILSACNTNCQYTFVDEVPTLTSLSITGKTVSIGLSDPSNLNSALGKLTVTLDSKPCTSLTGLMTSFTCTLPSNPDNTPILTAGSHYPVIKIDPIGYASIGQSITAITVAIALTSVNPNNGSTNGGYDVTIVGTGFPQNAKDITFKVCNQLCTIKSLTNVEAVLTMPACEANGATTIQAIFGTSNPTVAFNYNPSNTLVLITKISPTSASPVLKAPMTITGTGFGTDLFKLQVWMSNSSGNIYQMKIFSLNDTEIKAGIPGGRPGIFDITVIKDGFGSALPSPSTANDFTY